jgi:pSer/pThr/pTyr-binding forkhead associated (FHA) protein
MSSLLNIGRSKENEIVIDNDDVSKFHCQLIIDDDKNIFINDLKSLNGTFVNGKKIFGNYKLNYTDKVSIANIGFDWLNYLKEQGLIRPDEIKKFNIANEFPSFIISFAALFILIMIFFGLNEISSNNNSENNNSKNENPTYGNQKNREINYDFSCIVSEKTKGINDITNGIDDIRNESIKNSGIKVTIEEETKFGDENHEKLLQGSSTLEDNRSEKIKSILSKLQKKLNNPKGFEYKIYLIESDQINAWTCGGRIYFTTKMFDFTQNDDEIAGIIGHEIYHNELGHINNKLLVHKISTGTLGSDIGGIASVIDNILYMPFAKKDEAHCDFKGADLCIEAGFKPCEITKLWNRMSESEGETNTFDEFLRSHPLSSQREKCINNHLKVNYNLNCK